MSEPSLAELFAAVDGTWPAKAFHRLGPWLLREGQGGGSRISSASTEQQVTDADIDTAEAKFRELGQRPLFSVRPGNEALDALLAARGYKSEDATDIRMAPVSQFEPAAVMRSFAHWPPLALARDIWADNGVGVERQAIMARVEGPACAILARAKAGTDRAAGVAFVAVSGEIAMVHSLVVLPDFRRQGSAHHMMREAATWAQDNGAKWLALAVTRNNQAAQELYTSMNMPIVGGYHYRSA